MKIQTSFLRQGRCSRGATEGSDATIGSLRMDWENSGLSASLLCPACGTLEHVTCSGLRGMGQICCPYGLGMQKAGSFLVGTCSFLRGVFPKSGSQG